MSLSLFSPLAPDPTPLFLLVSPPPTPRRCADVQQRAMAAEEVKCGIFSGVVFADARSSLLFSPRLRDGKRLLDMAPLFASHLCCDWSHINFDAVFLFLCLSLSPLCRPYDHYWVGLSLSILFLLVIWKISLAADLFYYFYNYFFFAFASILSQCLTNIVYKPQPIHPLLFFFSFKNASQSGRTKKNKIQQHIWNWNCAFRTTVNFAASKQKLSNVICSWNASKVSLQGFCEALHWLRSDLLPPHSPRTAKIISDLTHLSPHSNLLAQRREATVFDVCKVTTKLHWCHPSKSWWHGEPPRLSYTAWIRLLQKKKWVHKVRIRTHELAESANSAIIKCSASSKRLWTDWIIAR